MDMSNINRRNYPGVMAKGSMTAPVVLAVIMLASAILRVNAQTGQTLYFMETLPQSALLNPAFQHAHNFHIGLPGISSVNVNASTNFATLGDIIFKHPQYDSLISFLHPDANLGDFTRKLRDGNSITPNLHINILSLGFRARRSFVSFNVSERVSGRVSLPGDLILLGLEGNEQFTGKTADLSGLRADLNYFTECAVGYAYRFSEKLNLGVRGKILFGKANVSFADTDMSLYTDPDSYSMRLKSKIAVNVSAPMTVIKDEEGDIKDLRFHFDDDDYDPLDFILMTKNSGYAIDIGATFRVINPVTIYASIVDLGFINWKQDVYNFSMNGDFEFDGLDFSPFFENEDDFNAFDNLKDTLQTLFEINDTQEAFRRGLPTRVYLGGTYNFHRSFSLGVLSRSELHQNNLDHALTFSANLNAGRRLSLSASYSVMNNSYNNFGAGLALRGLMFQFYVVTDNLNSAFMPHMSSSVNIWAGLNIVFGNVKTIQALPFR